MSDLETAISKSDNSALQDKVDGTLAQAIKETLNIDYDGQVGSTVLAGDGTAGTGG